MFFKSLKIFFPYPSPTAHLTLHTHLSLTFAHLKNIIPVISNHVNSYTLFTTNLLWSIFTHLWSISFMWPGSMQIYWNKRKRLNEKRVQLPQDCLGTPTWPPFHCFGTPIWPPWCHVKTLYKCTEPFNTTWPRCLTTTFFWPFQEQFCDYMFQQAIKNEWKAITENKSKFILVSQKAWNKGKILLLDSLSDCVTI